MNSQMIICDEIISDGNKYKLGTVLNYIDVPVFPYAQKLNVYIKLFDIPRTNSPIVSISIIDCENEIIGQLPHTVIRYDDDKIRGDFFTADISAQIMTVFCLEGKIEVKLSVDDQYLNKYPLIIRQHKSEV